VVPNYVTIGYDVSVIGTGFRPGEQVDIELRAPLGSMVHLHYAYASSSGAFAISGIKIPFGTVPGPNTVVASGLSSGITTQVTLFTAIPAVAVGITPASFAPDDTVLVSGVNFAPNEHLNLTLLAPAGGATLLGQTHANTSGQFAGVKFHIPWGLATGAQQLLAQGLTSGWQAVTSVVVEAPVPAVTLSTGSVKPGGTVTVRGSHFEPAEAVVVDVVTLAGSLQIGTARADSNGNFLASRLSIPAQAPEGNATIEVTGASSQLSGSKQLTIAPLAATLVLGQQTAVAGSTISLSGRGFVAGETVEIRISGGQVPALSLTSTAAAADGSYQVPVLSIPAYLPGATYTITAAGQTSGRHASVKLRVQAVPQGNPIISIVDPAHVTGQPYTTNPGALVQIAGSNFPSEVDVLLALQGSFGVIPLEALHSNAAGALGPTGVPLPVFAPLGRYNLAVMSGSTVLASSPLQVIQRTPAIAIILGSISSGATVKVSGSGFAPGEEIVLALNGVAITTNPGTLLADGSGGFITAITLPKAVTIGLNLLTATGGSSRASASLTVKSATPAATHWYFPAGDTHQGAQTVISVFNPDVDTAHVTLTFLTGMGAERQKQLTLQPHHSTNVNVASVTGSGRFVSTIVSGDRQIAAVRTITYSGQASTAAIGASAPATTWYLAEGYTGNGFRELLTFLNPNMTPATIDVRFLPQNRSPLREVRLSIAAHAYLQIDVGQYMPLQSSSTIVTANIPIVVERSTRFGLNDRGAANAVASTSPSTIWFFAQGVANASLQTFLSVLNPSPVNPAQVTATLYDELGRIAGSRTIMVAPLRRGTIKLNSIQTPAGYAAAGGIVVTANVPVVAERAQYEGPANLRQAWAGSAVFGRNGGALTWLITGTTKATGTTNRLTVFDTGLKVARVNATIFEAQGRQAHQLLILTPDASGTIPLDSVPSIAAGPFSVLLHSENGQPFMAELVVTDLHNNYATVVTGNGS
jgi:hypothetical protein